MSNKKHLLPYGDTLRDFLNSANISKSVLRGITRRRGVFFADEEKFEYIPYLVKTGITPSELNEVLEEIKEREESPKRLTQVVKCVQSNKSLVSVIPAGYNVSDLVNKPFSNYRLLGTPSFKKVDGDPNYIELDFTIERHNYTQSWDKNTTQFSGKVKFKKKGGSLDINISLSHTSPETKEVAKAIAADFTNVLKSSGLVERKEKVRKIRFNDFSNEKRIEYLRKLSQQQTKASLYFKDTKDIGFCPDGKESFPSELEWMQEKVSNLIMQGKDLHSTFFIKNKKLHKFIEMYKVDASYTFDLDECSGTCKISYGFPDFLPKDDKSAELIINVSSVRINEKRSEISQTKIREAILTHLEDSKLELHNQLADVCSS
ncbi:GapS4b family protein [Shewanella chilikensis]|uniref:GapS4b family protein n=1 Tax=Shewanella chilikensis TaxID=558541 RepID=UPI001CF9989E|nr:hypothetical protein [Shewanella chilikensis]MCE9853497.1 hypothetical protein [Shewanella chilikensis]